MWSQKKDGDYLEDEENLHWGDDEDEKEEKDPADEWGDEEPPVPSREEQEETRASIREKAEEDAW